MTPHQQQKKINPAWVAVALTLIATIIAWASSYAVNAEKVGTLEKQYSAHCAKQDLKEQRTDDKLEKILQGLARVETKLDVQSTTATRRRVP